MSLPTEEGLAFVTTGDWNGDGCGDMATVNQKTGTVSVWLATKDGSFSRTDYPTGADSKSLVQGDWNGDHAWDLAAGNYADKSLSVLIGRGDGTFDQALRLGMEASPFALAAGDVNGDGQTDLVSMMYVSDSGTTTLSVWLGTRTGLGTRQDQGFPSFYPSFLVMGDFDGNGTMDLVGGGSGSGAKILLGDGAGQFAAPQSVGRGGRMAAADFNHDGNLDLGVADTGGRGWNGGVSLIPGTGSGSFSGETVLLPQNSYAVVAGDLDHDGYSDLAALTSNRLNVWHGDAQGLAQTYKTYAAGGYSMAMGDLNCDGTPDLATVSWTSVSVLLADRDGF